MTTIRALRPEDKRDQFKSGDVDLDRFLAKYAGQNQFKHYLGVTYVALDDQDSIVGYVTVAAGSIEVEDLPATAKKKLPQYPLPVLRVARLAVEERFAGQGVGKALLRFAFDLAVDMGDRFGCVGVVVDAKPGKEGYYAPLGFEPLELLEGESGARPQPTAMFLALDVIRKAKAP